MTRLRPIAGSLLLALAGCTTHAPPPEADAAAREEERPHRVDVVVRVGDAGPEIVDLSVTHHDGEPHPASVPPNDGEVDGEHFLTLHGPDGTTLHRVPVATGRAPRSFVHRPHESHADAMTGGLIAYEDETRVVSLPLVPGATHLGLDGDSHLELLHDGSHECPPCVGQPALIYPEKERDAGEVLDIVILGDGFHETENDFFVARAHLLAESLLDTEPFKRHADKIQIHMIPTVSKDSGVDDPTSGTLKDTCLGLTGGTIGCCGTDSPQELWKALGCRFPVRQVDLRVVIANVPVYGGRGHSDVRAAYINAYSEGKEDKFVGVAIHEIGHALAGLADEYAGCDPVTGPKELFANMATLEQVEAGTVPWLDLARPDELIDAKHFRYRYDLPKAEADVCHSGIPSIPDEYQGKLGLFWGAMYVDGDKSLCPQGCNVWGDPRGANYYRPMAKCKMRYVFDDFCRVCDREMEKAVLRYVVNEIDSAHSGPSCDRR